MVPCEAATPLRHSGVQVAWITSESEPTSDHLRSGWRPGSVHQRVGHDQASSQRLCGQAPASSLIHHSVLLASLSTHLSTATCKSLDSRSFLPRSQLATIIESFQIPKDVPRTLMILILLDKQAYIIGLLSRGFADSCLPIRGNDILEEKMPGMKREDSTSTVLSRCFKNWATKDMKAFMNAQWMVLSPFFAKSADDISLYDFDSDAILPFMEDEPAMERAGGYGVVRRVKIHSSHHDFEQKTVC